ncbi:MAG: hypothetical protein D3920_16885 [Candidatus Electrothrix sp. AW2]|nr:hypothetical protein [Candidatus Electrothrix gigas]
MEGGLLCLQRQGIHCCPGRAAPCFRLVLLGQSDAPSFFFQEGDAKLYGEARYGELKVDESGGSVLVGLCGEDFRPLGKGQ